MATSSTNTAQVTIFDPVIYHGGTGDFGYTGRVDFGFIGDTVSFQYTQNLADYTSGIPKSLRKSIKVEESAMLKFDLMETSIGAMQSALNRQSGDLVSTSFLKIGGDSEVNVLTNVHVEGTDDQGKKMRVLFFKGIVKEVGEFNIDDNFMKIPVTITAVADLTRATGDQLVRIMRGNAAASWAFDV